MCSLQKTIVALTGFAALGAIGAADAGAQVSSTEVYQLSTVGGNPLPTVIEENSDCHDEIVSASLTLGTDSRWTLAMDEREVCPNHSASETDEEGGTYHIEGETIHFMDDDGQPFAADEDATELELDLLRDGTRSDSGLRVTIADEDTVLEFTR